LRVGPFIIARRYTYTYEPGDIEDRYETRLRAMIDAKLKGEGIDVEAAPEPVATNVIGLMAALRRSIAEDDKAKAEPAPQPEKAKPTKAAAPKGPRKRAS
jgi:DNA end-binding protein Ku